MHRRDSWSPWNRGLAACFVLLLTLPAARPSNIVEGAGTAPVRSAQTPTSAWANYSTGDDVVALARDPATGGLVAATTGGAVFWATDGTHAKVTAADGLCANWLTDVAVAADGEAWFATIDGGLCGRDALGRWHHLNPTTPGPLERETALWAVAADADGWWASGGLGALLLLENGRWTRQSLPAPLAGADVDDLAVAPDGSLWVVASSDGALAARRSRDGRWRVWSQADGLPAAAQGRRLAVDVSGDVWIGALNYGEAARFGRDGRWHAVDWYDGGPIAADPSGGVWTAAVTWHDENGDFADDLVVRHAAGEDAPTTFVWANQFEGSQATAIVADGSGGTWIGTDGRGLVHLSAGGTWSRRGCGDPVPDNQPVAVAFGPDGSAWMAYNSALFTGVVRRDAAGAWTPLPMPDSLAWIEPTAPCNAAALRGLADIAVASDGTVWTAGEGVLSLGADGGWALEGDPGAPEVSLDVAAAPDGSVWFGTAAGVLVHAAAGDWRRLETGLAQLEDEVHAIAFDADGRAWLCTPGGVGRQSGTGWLFSALPEAQADSGLRLSGGLAVEDRGNVWVATSDEKLGFFRNGSFESVGVAAGLELATAWSQRLVADPRGDGVWASAVRLPVDDDGSLLAFDGGLLHRRSSGLWDVASPWDGLGGRDVVDLAVDRTSGDLLAAVSGGVARLATDALPDDGSSLVYLPLAQSARSAEPPGNDADEYAVYRAAIEHMFGDVGYQRYVIRDRTWPYELGDLDYLRDQMPELDRATHVAYSRRNREAHPLSDAFGLSIPVRLISREELDDIFGSPEGWDEFYRRYPGSQGEMTLSRVGFDEDRGQALLYLGNMSHWLAGSGWALLLERSGRDWTVVGHAFLWIS